jgi:hypothetical protein
MSIAAGNNVADSRHLELTPATDMTARNRNMTKGPGENDGR